MKIVVALGAAVTLLLWPFWRSQRPLAAAAHAKAIVDPASGNANSVKQDNTRSAQPQPSERVAVVHELVRATDVESPLPGPSPTLKRVTQTRKRPVGSARNRSLLARLFFGDGARRPQPFPRPGR